MLPFYFFIIALLEGSDLRQNSTSKKMKDTQGNRDKEIELRPHEN
jgi:hypothetical protein